MAEIYDAMHDMMYYTENTRSSTRFVAEIGHKGLKTYRVIKDLDDNILLRKVEAQFSIWDEKWEKIERKSIKEQEKSASLSLAEEMTNDARKVLQDIDELLIYAINNGYTFDWEASKDKSTFDVPNPKSEILKRIADLKESFLLNRKPTEPRKEYYQPDFDLLDSIFKSLKKKKILKAEEIWQNRIAEWRSDMAVYEKKKFEFENKKEELLKESEEIEKKWKQEEDDFYLNQKEINKEIDELRKLNENHDPLAVIKYFELVLYNSIYPDTFPKDFDLDYNLESKILIVEYLLPSIECFPDLVEVKYIATKEDLKYVYLSEPQLSKIYDNSIYKIILRTIYEIFTADKYNSIEAVILNGWVNAVNKATGKIINSCITSIEVKKSEFQEINLAYIDPKTCFKNLKGIGSSKLSSMVAIQPIASIDKNDSRFIPEKNVIDKLNEGSNIASMDWQEFEHLIREIFEQEFQTNGGEVKVTQASRDGGVDAVAFDPDPIRGGKIVIQAKRYVNTVGVSAVRDLYGTVLNEGATKGILVTTADYGPDAYEFAKNKPLTLMNGSNLLYLLQKHGRKARIDISEAKRLGIENER